jgi:hypothetical protein
VVNAGASGLYLTGGGTVEFGANSDMSSLDSGHNGSNLSLVIGAGTAVLDADTFGSTSAFEMLGGNGIVLNGAFTGTQDISDERASGSITGGQAVSSGWSGNIYFDNNPATQTFSQVAGGRFTYSGYMHGNNATYLITSGGGTVVLSGASTYTGNNTLAADLNAARTLITNPAGTSAFGNNTGVVQVEAGKLLGGNGTSSQTVVAMAATSILTAGDPGDAGLGISPQISILHLQGGLMATSGLTLDIKLSGVDDSPNIGSDNDYIDLSVGDFTLAGNVTVNFTTLDTIETDNPYDLIGGTGTWTEDPGTNFVFTAPAGYAVESYDFDTTHDRFTVQFEAAPEPSTYGLLGLGLLALVAIGRFRRATV